MITTIQGVSKDISTDLEHLHCGSMLAIAIATLNGIEQQKHYIHNYVHNLANYS